MRRPRQRVTRRTVLKVGGGLMVGAAVRRACGAAQARGLSYEEYAKYDGLGLAELVKRGEVKPEELLEAAIARAEAVNPEINAIVGGPGELFEKSRREIAAGLPDGPFRGVPFLLKDLTFAMKGVPCSAGSKLFENRRSEADSTAVKRYRRSGLGGMVHYCSFKKKTHHHLRQWKTGT